MVKNYPNELICDMAETYGIFDIKRVPARLLATLAVGLRENSRSKMAKTNTKVEDNTYLLAVIADTLRVLAWRMTEDGQNGVNQPKLFTELWAEPEEKEYQVFSSPEEFNAKWQKITGNKQCQT